jgi:3-hydroxyacyl-CoA dehydrogenase
LKSGILIGKKAKLNPDIMTYTTRLSNVSVIGAAGKMGSGILLLMAKELFDLSRKPENEKKKFSLNAIDISQDALNGVLKYIEKQCLKTAERKPDTIKPYFRGETIRDDQLPELYARRVLDLIEVSTDLTKAYNATVVFEAASEDKDLKIKLLRQIHENSQAPPWFLTNTSSIPISYIDEHAGLEGRIIGFHFYNPPAVQKLVELIATDHTREELVELAQMLAQRLGKVIVPANDIAGFIGNGHFMRDALYGFSEARRLEDELGFVKAVYAINQVSQKFLVRPMGIFQLCDYVGLDVVQFIMKVMNPYMEGEDLHSKLLDDMVDRGVKGGQNPDGSQKDGFLRYEAGKVTGVYNFYTGTYTDLDEIKSEVDAFLGTLPDSFKPWKDTIQSQEKEKDLERYFGDLKKQDTKGAELAMKYGSHSKHIGLHLVETGVSDNEDNVNKVLLTGFYHAYGPVNAFFD